jgi:hypothetical protein
VSDSILYLAIVAIWAGFLIPAWVRRPHSAKTEQECETVEFEIDFDSETGPDPAVHADPRGGAERGAERPQRHFETEPRPAYQSPERAFSPAPTADLDTSVPDDVSDNNSEYRDDVHPHNYAPAERAHDPQRPATQSSAGPSQSREQMLRARRRMLTILVGLTFATALFALTGLVQWWICVPPVALLVLYVLLLREIALADAELASKRQAWEAAQAREAHQRQPARQGTGQAARQADRQADDWRLEQERSEPQAPEQTAEIIDISGRVGDQLYDQYADAAVRAVGD